MREAFLGLQVLDATWAVSEGPNGMEAALDRICQEADQAIEEGYSYLIISDRATGQNPCIPGADWPLPIAASWHLPFAANRGLPFSTSAQCVIDALQQFVLH